MADARSSADARLAEKRPVSSQTDRGDRGIVMRLMGILTTDVGPCSPRRPLR
jgi:hypothetical protein